jgi:hypothetical protein
MPGGHRPPLGLPIQSSCFGLEELGRSARDEREDPTAFDAGLRIQQHGETITAVTPAAALALRTQDPPHRSRPSQQQYLVGGRPRIDRCTYHAIADPACEPACDLGRIIQPAATLQNRVTALRGSPSPNARRTSGEPDAHFRLKDPVDQLANDHARRNRLFPVVAGC